MSGWVQKRQSGRWMARYRAPDGKTRSKTWDRKTDAERWLRVELAAATVANGSTRSSGRQSWGSGPRPRWVRGCTRGLQRERGTDPCSTRW